MFFLFLRCIFFFFCQWEQEVEYAKLSQFKDYTPYSL